MKRNTIITLTLGLALAVPAAAEAKGLSVHRARQAVVHYAQRDVRTGDATGYRVRDCRRDSQRSVHCQLTEYGVYSPMVDATGTLDSTTHATLGRGRVGVAMDGVTDDTPYSERP